MKSLIEKIEIARRLNREYNAPGRNMQVHREAYMKAVAECESVGIEPDIIQIRPDVFELLVQNKAVELYIHEEPGNGKE